MEYFGGKRRVRVMVLLFGHDKTVADWVSKKTGTPLRNWHHAIGIINDDGLLIGCASFHDMNGSNVEVCFYGPHSLNVSIVRKLMHFAFVTLNANRVSARTPRQNKAIARHLERLGFVREGVVRRYYAPQKRWDAMLFGMLKGEAERYLRTP